MSKVNEASFEEAIAQHLVEYGGYLAVKRGVGQHGAADFDPSSGLDTAELFAFIGATQADEWAKLIKHHGGNPDTAQRKFVLRLAQQIDDRGTLDVLRHGVMDGPALMRLAYFKPAHALTPELVARYDANRLTVTRQLAYDAASTKTLDLCLFVNGLPVATAELKNPLTGQSVDHAAEQYRNDRDPRNATLGRRALVHFAVDPERVAMTTRLDGPATRFLPFNLGSGGGAGNPVNPHGHRTSYLWERLWAKDAWLDLLARFIHVDRPASGTAAQKKAAELVVFPRFHQWDAVLALEAHARANRAGKSYLVQHSAGSGKSNTIAWTAHRLSTLHDDDDRKVFDKVIVITDRVILDRQLQETIYQFEHARGVVVKIDHNSQQLADALAGEQARIIITTLQKFPFVLDKVAGLPSRRYAVIVDEAHSSQTGEAAKDLRLALGTDDETELTAAEAEDMGLVADPIDPVEEALAKAVGARGKQANLSFFAFTATPKARTLELFGTFDTEERRYHPFHLYSMRQAIEEGFILDVLSNYTTYQTFWRIEKAIADDPAYESVQARRAIARFVSLHPHNLAQKAEIIVEHFRTHTAGKIGGRAKAMVVTSSRLHAVRYKQAIDAHIAIKGYTDIAALVAFSGKVITDDCDPYTEARMNGLPEAQTAEAFAGDDYQVLVVAEKFQTGFDQPLLHTMYVDKVLTGLSAVQTLSRLNRIYGGKSDTFVLDFRNDGEAIQAAFEPYYGTTVAPPSDPNLLWDTRHRLDEYDLLRPEEVETTVALLLTFTGSADHGRVEAALAPAVERFRALEGEDSAGCKDALDKFVRTYAFMAQIVTFGETKLERDYLFCRALATYLRSTATYERLDLGTEVELTHLRTEAQTEGALTLTSETGEVKWVTGDGMGSRHDPDVEPLSAIIHLLNDRYGLNLGDADQLLFDQYEEDWAANPGLADQARNNTLDNFRLVFDPLFLNTVVSRMDANDAIYKRILDDPDFRDVLNNFYLRKMYARLRSPAKS
ncbi:MAG TPA: type I restriction endonuclease [Ilumatobacteraceae bacterium]|nr:type I restriction endonuclease [Ilumatobacteraceae bacterium]